MNGFDKAKIGRDEVSGFQQDDVARYYIERGERSDLLLTSNARCRRGELFDSLHGSVRPIFLHKSDDAVEYHDDNNRQGIQTLSQHARDNGGPNKHQDHKIGELINEDSRETALAMFGNGVLAMLVQPAAGFPGIQSRVRIDFQSLTNIRNRESMPDRVAWR